jgi:hypothetical protein
MPRRPEPVKSYEGDFEKFKEFGRRIFAVPHSEIKAKIDAEKRERQQRRKPASDRVSRAKA